MTTDVQPALRALIAEFPGLSNPAIHQMLLQAHPEFRQLSQTWFRTAICRVRQQLRRRKRIDLRPVIG